MSAPVIVETHLEGVPLLFRGKVRDIYDLGDRLLLIATDRISAFDVVLPTPIPDKGIVLTQLSAFWFRKLSSIVPNHFISAEVADFPPVLAARADILEGRAMLARKAQRIDVECVVRGYLAGSAWSEYRARGTVCGQALRPGLGQSARLDPPLFTPAAKASSGHDENISIEVMARRIGRDLSERVIAVSTEIYVQARDFAWTRGLILADTKLEFGLLDGKLLLIDELLTPDSSRYWDAERYEVGRAQPSFDKQFARDWLETSGWDKREPAPDLPPDVVEHTTLKYREAYRRLVGVPLLGRLP